MSDSDDVRSLLAKHLKLHGFKRFKSLWVIDKDEVIWVAHIQKWSHGPYFWLNVGIWVKSLEPDKEPVRGYLHMESRGPFSIGKLHDDWNLAIDETTDLTPEQRDAIIGENFERSFMPFIERLSTEHAVLEYAREAILYSRACREAIKQDKEKPVRPPGLETFIPPVAPLYWKVLEKYGIEHIPPSTQL